MSNFIRYVLYRQNNFHIVSVDNLIFNNKKSIYTHKKHKFYLGDITNKDFMYKIIDLEKPDYAIIGINSKNKYDFIIDSISITKLLDGENIPFIQLCSPQASEILKVFNENILKLPNIFGFRQNIHNGLLSKLIYNIKQHGQANIRDANLPWAYVEDVASLIWFIIENRISSEIGMPVLGHMNEKSICDIIIEEFDLDFKIMYEKYDDNLDFPYVSFSNPIVSYRDYTVKGWKPDSMSLEEQMRKTIKWYYVNKNWVLGGNV